MSLVASLLEGVVHLPLSTRIDVSIFDVMSALPADLRSFFAAQHAGTAVVLTYDGPQTRRPARDQQLMRAARSFIKSGYVAAFDGSSIRVTKPTPFAFAEVET